VRERTFKKADLQRAITVAREAEFPIERIEITKDGRIVLIPGTPPKETVTEVNDWEGAKPG
jgi:hypothetical protein